MSSEDQLQQLALLISQRRQAACHPLANTWRRAPGAARSKALGDAAAALEHRAAEITTLTVREVGKPVTEARGEVARGVSIP